MLIFRIKRIEVKHPTGFEHIEGSLNDVLAGHSVGQMTVCVQQGDRIEGGFLYEFRWMTQGCYLYIEATSGSLRRHLFAHVHTFHGVTEP